MDDPLRVELLLLDRGIMKWQLEFRVSFDTKKMSARAISVAT